MGVAYTTVYLEADDKMVASTLGEVPTALAAELDVRDERGRPTVFLSGPAEAFDALEQAAREAARLVRLRAHEAAAAAAGDQRG